MKESLILEKNPRYKNINSSMVVNIDKKETSILNSIYNYFFKK